MLKLRPGARLEILIEPADPGFTVTIQQAVGSSTKEHGRKRVKTEEAMWLAVIRWAEARLAHLGLEKTEKT